MGRIGYRNLQQRIIDCEACPRLRAYGAEVAVEKRRAFREWDYWGRPVPNFGVARAPLVIVGLAPAAHGAHRTGRMFTGDRSGDWLYASLFRNGFANQPNSVDSDDGLKLNDCLITAINHCAPPDNKPTREEQINCQPFLVDVMRLAPRRVVVCLGKIAWDGAFRVFRELTWWQGAVPAFQHAAEVRLAGDRWCLASYHPSQQNTFTGRLTEPMLDAVFDSARQKLSSG